MKYIYFVRHGESQANAEITGIGMDSPLTEKGREQAGFIAERCKRLPIQVIISSTMNRARETAEVVLKRIQKPMEVSEHASLFHFHAILPLFIKVIGP